MDDVLRRLETLERRVARLESAGSSSVELQPEYDANAEDPTTLIQVQVTNKRYQPQNSNRNQFQAYIWYDCTYVALGLQKPTRSVKGVMTFADLFGEVKFSIGITINNRLDPGKKLTTKSVGFEYNQFMDDHNWMLVTDERDMKAAFSVTDILYQDGTSKSFVNSYRLD